MDQCLTVTLGCNKLYMYLDSRDRSLPSTTWHPYQDPRKVHRAGRLRPRRRRPTPRRRLQAPSRGYRHLHPPRHQLFRRKSASDHVIWPPQALDARCLPPAPPRTPEVPPPLPRHRPRRPRRMHQEYRTKEKRWNFCSPTGTARMVRRSPCFNSHFSCTRLRPRSPARRPANLQ